jgi:hypothetical protein
MWVRGAFLNSRIVCTGTVGEIAGRRIAFPGPLKVTTLIKVKAASDYCDKLCARSGCFRLLKSSYWNFYG